MPLPNFVTLNANPNQLLAWLNNNLLMAGALQNVGGNGLTRVSITARLAPAPGMPAPTATDSFGNAVGVYELRSNALGANVLDAYVCDYTANNVHSVDIDNQVGFVFTTNLNGCTFAFSPQNHGSCRVTHANTGGNTVLQRQQITNQHNNGLNGLTLLEPSQYRRLNPNLNLQATVFGVLVGGVWQFYFQSYTALGGSQFRLNGVFPIL